MISHRRRALAAFGSLLMCAALLPAQDAPAIAKYVPPAPDSRHVFVMDSAHVLSESMIRALQDSAQALQTATGADIAWVTLPTLGGRPIEDATVFLGRTWKIGSAGEAGDPMRNRGLLILYIPDKTKTAGSNFRVEVGKGLQGTIIDSRSKSIAAAMRDDLRAKRYDAAYLRGWAIAAAMVREDFATRGVASPPAPKPVQHASPDTESHPVFGVVFAIVLVLLLIYLMRRTRRAGSPTTVFPVGASNDDDDWRRRSSSSSSSWSSSDTSSSSDSGSSSGGDFGGGGGFDGGGSSDSI